jgi:DNA (cytosine-5)-methyltransferase 1
VTRRRSNIIRALDLFAGIGGSSRGAQLAGVEVVAAVDNWELAKQTYLDNHKDVRFFREKCENLDPRGIQRQIGRIDLLIASPECTSHTCAKGSARRSETSRRTAFEVTKFVRCLKPRWIVIENVVHMRSWSRYEEWIRSLKSLNYNVRQQTLNAADFGVPQSRRRLFVMCDLKVAPKAVHPKNAQSKHSALELIDLNGTYAFAALRSKGRAKATLERAKRAISALSADEPFLLVYYGSDGAGGWQRVDAPLRTVTTVDRFAFVRPTASGHEMRMLQVPELKRAMGFPASYLLNHGTRRDRIKLLGNAVCPPVMRAVIRSLTDPD